jgi:hypothetical protein
MDGHPFTVIGVAPPGFIGVFPTTYSARKASTGFTDAACRAGT